MTPRNDATAELTLLGLANLVEQDGITSDILPAYLQVLLSVRLIEPDYMCRKAAMTLVVNSPPFSPAMLAGALRAMADHRPAVPPETPKPRKLSLNNILSRVYRLWSSKMP